MTEPMHPEIKQLYEEYFDKCFAAFAKDHKKAFSIPTWPALMRGVRVDGDTVVISTKNNDAARELCGALIDASIEGKNR